MEACNVTAGHYRSKTAHATLILRLLFVLENKSCVRLCASVRRLQMLIIRKRPSRWVFYASAATHS